MFGTIISRLQRQIEAEYDVTTTIKHRGERGRQREQGLARFLEDTLPGACGVATGEIISCAGSQSSPQCDIIIYDRLHYPILGRGTAVQQVPIEGVYSVIECKSVITAAELSDAKKKFAAIRKLPRLTPPRSAPNFFLFGYRMKTTTERCKSFVEDTSEDCDTVVCSLDKGISMWVGDDKTPDWCAWLNCKIGRNYSEALAVFYMSLLRSVQDTDLGKPDVLRMIFPGVKPGSR